MIQQLFNSCLSAENCNLVRHFCPLPSLKWRPYGTFYVNVWIHLFTFIFIFFSRKINIYTPYHIVQCVCLKRFIVWLSSKTQVPCVPPVSQVSPNVFIRRVRRTNSVKWRVMNERRSTYVCAVQQRYACRSLISVITAWHLGVDGDRQEVDCTRMRRIVSGHRTEVQGLQCRIGIGRADYEALTKKNLPLQWKLSEHYYFNFNMNTPAWRALFRHWRWAGRDQLSSQCWWFRSLSLNEGTVGP